MFPSRNIKIKRTYVTTFPSFHSQVRSGQGRRQLRVPGKKTRGFPRKKNNRYIQSVFEFQVSTVPKKMHFFNLAVVGESHARIFFFFRSIEHFPYKKRKIFFSNRKNGDGFPTVRIGTASQIKFGFGGGKTHIPVDVFQSLPPPSLPDSDPFNLNPGNKTRNISPKKLFSNISYFLTHLSSL